MAVSSIDLVLRPAFEYAIEAARSGARETPPEIPPPVLRRFLSFSRLPDSSLARIREVLDSEPDFRARVAETATEGLVGAAGLAWLTRSPGWEAEVEEAARQHATVRADQASARDERDLARRVAGLESALARAERTAADAEAERDYARTALAEERRRRASTEQSHLATEQELRSAQEELDRVRAELATAVAGFADSTALLEDLRTAVATAAASPAAQASSASAVSQTLLADALARIRVASSELGEAVTAAEALLEPPSAADDEAGPEARRSKASVARRRPLRLAKGVLEDSRQAVEQLLRLPRVVVLVDGYNVSMAAWPALTAAEQREALLNACEQFEARFGSEFHLVFDSSDAGMGSSSSARAPRRARVRFAPSGSEADDLVLDLVERFPPERPVVVVSDDRRVQDGARERGANVLSTRAFVASLAR